MRDQYFNQGEVSNSDLGELKKFFMPRTQVGDIQEAYRFGTLVDALITEPHKVNHFKHTVDEEQYTPQDFDKARKMADSFWQDEMCGMLAKQSNFQKVMSRKMAIEYSGIDFELPVRCKWDLWMEQLVWGGDIKSTTATTQKQFEAALSYFEYDRQRAWYMDIAGSPRDMLIGISKVNFKVFKIAITRDGEIYKRGKEKYSELAFKYWYLFNNF